MLLFNHIENALASIKSNATRSILTTLGVAIGIASITAILALSAGAQSVIGNQVDALGGTVGVVRPGAPNKTLTNLTSIGQTYGASTLTKVDIESLKKTPHIEAVAPLMTLQGAIKSETTAAPHGTIIATTPELEGINGFKLLDGQFLDTSLVETTAVIGYQLAIDLFGTEQVIGKTASIRGESFTIVGILKPLNESINFSGANFDNSILIGFESGILQNQGTAHIQQINFSVDSIQNLESVVVAANKTLLKNHYGEVDFSVLTGEAISQSNSQLFTLFTGLFVAVAAISLFVGGIGIMNIMLVSVAERTREIGIRKAMGATNNAILLQFTAESLLLSLIGGIVGFGIGYLGAHGISLFLNFEPSLSWEVVIVTLSASAITGVLFGIFPALKAARKDPIDALKLYT